MTNPAEYAYPVQVGKTGDHQNVALAEFFPQILARHSRPVIFDVEYSHQFGHNGSSNIDIEQDIVRQVHDERRWLRERGSAYRIEAFFEAQEFNTGDDAEWSLLGANTDVVGYGYTIIFHFEQAAEAMLFKLTFGGAA